MNMSDAELDRLLSLWATRHRLTDAQVTELRARVMAAGADHTEALDQDWFWRLLRPLTELVDQLDHESTRTVPRRARAWTTYLQLA